MEQSTIPSKYTSLTGQQENRRLDIQNRALGHFDRDIYLNILGKYCQPIILDVGCGTGTMMSHILADIPSHFYVGIDKMPQQIELARRNVQDGIFRTADVEREGFLSTMKTIMEECGIKCFDVINCSMVIMHLTDPISVLAHLKPLLGPGGTLIVRDIDDGLQYAWPDAGGRFARLFDIIALDTRMGDRHCGRKIFSYLKNAGFQTVRLNRAGLSTASIDDKLLLYELAIPTLLHYMEQRHLKEPDNAQWKVDYEWFRDNIYAMEQSFHKDDFIFSAGFMNFTAE